MIYEHSSPWHLGRSSQPAIISWVRSEHSKERRLLLQLPQCILRILVCHTRLEVHIEKIRELHRLVVLLRHRIPTHRSRLHLGKVHSESSNRGPLVDRLLLSKYRIYGLKRPRQTPLSISELVLSFPRQVVPALVYARLLLIRTLRELADLLLHLGKSLNLLVVSLHGLVVFLHLRGIVLIVASLNILVHLRLNFPSRLRVSDTLLVGCRLESLFALIVVIQILKFLDRAYNLVEKIQFEFKEPMDSILITIS